MKIEIEIDPPGVLDEIAKADADDGEEYVFRIKNLKCPLCGGTVFSAEVSVMFCMQMRICTECETCGVHSEHDPMFLDWLREHTRGENNA